MWVGFCRIDFFTFFDYLQKAFSGCSSLKFIITANPLLLIATAEQKEVWGINDACEIITPGKLLDKPEVQEKLSSFEGLKLTKYAQNYFLVMFVGFCRIAFSI